MRAFLTDSLSLWRVEGTVEAGDAPVVAIIRADTGAIVWIERAAYTVRPERSDAESKDERVLRAPFRWFVRWRGAGEDAGSARETRPRPCGSLVGVLNAVRGALGVDRGSAVRIAK